jgi:hypothetical protein
MYVGLKRGSRIGASEVYFGFMMVETGCARRFNPIKIGVGVRWVDCMEDWQQRAGDREIVRQIVKGVVLLCTSRTKRAGKSMVLCTL